MSEPPASKHRQNKKKRIEGDIILHKKVRPVGQIEKLSESKFFLKN